MTYYDDGTVTVHAGDCRDLLRELPDNSVDAVVTDPPYDLTTGKQGGSGVASVNLDSPYGRSRVTTGNGPGGFMGKAWDGTGVAFDPETWRLVLRVLKPGGHLLAFGGTRTSHRLACAIEDAGFEIRDSIAWLYGSGFPKSLDVSKAIDRARDDRPDVLRVTSEIARLRDAAGMTNRDLDDLFGFAGMAGHWTSVKSQPTVPTVEQWATLRERLSPDEWLDAEVWRLNGRKGTPGEAWEQREVVGVQTGAMAGWSMDGTTKFVDRNITTPATDDARTWQGWGTALKPSHEPIVVARKPLDGTVAGNVLRWGTGALNIADCRVTANGQHPDSPTSLDGDGSNPGDNTTCTCLSPADDQASRTPSRLHPVSSDASPEGRNDLPASAPTGVSDCPPLQDSLADCRPSPRSDGGRVQSKATGDPTSELPPPDALASLDPQTTPAHTRDDPSKPCPHHTARHVERSGRWPPNAILSPDAAAELDRQSGTSTSPPVGSVARTSGGETIGTFAFDGRPPSPNGHGDSGGGSRFFPVFKYEAKAPTSERPRMARDGARRAGVAYTAPRCTKCGRQQFNLPDVRCACPEPDFQPDPAHANHVAHPTVKPLDLMRWLVRLVGGQPGSGSTILDPFAGSGTTGEAAILEGFNAILIEREPDYLPLIVSRLTRRTDPAAYAALHRTDDEPDDLLTLLDGGAA